MKRFARWLFILTHEREMQILLLEMRLDTDSDSLIAHRHALGVRDALETLTLIKES